MDPSAPITTALTSGGDAVGDSDAGSDIVGVGALADPIRRALYRYVASQASPVNREQAAEAIGIARHTAKFHLDKLVAGGLLDVEFARPPGRTGPGAGRPAKLFRRSAREWSVSLPARRYDLAGHLLARAVIDAERDGLTATGALARVARDRGRLLGDDVRRRAGARPSRAKLLAETTTVLTESGYEPRADPAGLTLANCPFHSLAREYTDLVCGMNLALIEGLLESGGGGLEAALDPSPDRCCVRIRTSKPKTSAERNSTGCPTTT